MSDNISCPVSNIRVNEHRVRLTASLVFILTVSYLLVPDWVVPAGLTIDFFLRGLGKGTFSPLGLFSGWLVRTLGIKNKPVDQAPKVFAARLGFSMCLLLTLASIFSLNVAANVIASIMVLFSFLESALAFCAGCYVYSFLYRFSNK